MSKHNKKANCEICDKEFITNRIKQRFCSLKCSQKSWRVKTQKQRKLVLKTGETNNAYLKLRFEIFKRDGFRCAYCGRNPKEDGVKLVIDHIIPKSKGGKLVADNLVSACYDCNSGKRDALLEARILSPIYPTV